MEENLKRYRRGRMAMTLPDMPHDIVINILSRLPVKSLMRFRCVCKSWHALVSDPNFVDMHLNQTYANNKGYVLMSDDGDNFSFHCGETFVLHRRLEVPFKIPFERFMVEGYCNGLICLRYRRIPIYDSDMYLWNPSIRKFKVLPESKFRGRRSTPKLGKMFTVFGFCPQINDYRVVNFVYRILGRGPSMSSPWGLLKLPPRVEVYSLKLNSWKEVQNVIPCVIDCLSKYSILNGVVHWVARMDTGENRDYEFILSFDMANEVFDKIKLPECCRGDHVLDKFALVLKESLSLFVPSRESTMWRMDIWVMTEYGSAESWTKQFTFGQRVTLSPLGFLKNGEVVLKNEKGKLVLYDPRVQQVKHLHISGLPQWVHVFTYCMESLVLLNEGNWVLEQPNLLNPISFIK